MTELENMNVFIRLRIFIKEVRLNSKMGRMLLTALACIERETGIKTSRVARMGIDIDHAANGWWKGTLQRCSTNKMKLDVFDSTPVPDAETFMERATNKGSTKREIKIINCMRITWKTWRKEPGFFNEFQREHVDVNVAPIKITKKEMIVWIKALKHYHEAAFREAGNRETR